jgi:hypothetical protein
MATTEARLEREALRQLNLYEVLQVSAKASPEVVHAAYRVLARIYHPDLNDSLQAARMMRQVNAAYRVLSDPERRAKYDLQRAHTWRARPHVTTRGSAAAAEHPSRPSARTTSINSRVVLNTTPAFSGWRIGRLIGLLLFLASLFGAMLFALWLIFGMLEDEAFHLLGAG